MKDKIKIHESMYLAEKEKDSDIHLLANISKKVSRINGTKFVLTGSYAIEALTGQETYHEDIDANILTGNIDDSLPKVANKLGQISGLEVYKRTQNRLEYDILPNTDRIGVKKLEFQFHKLDEKNDIPTVFAPLTDSKRKDFSFRVKSIPYVIATWSIRISGLATNPLRELKISDLEQFKLLLSCNHNVDDVLNIIKRHPQMPLGADEREVLEKSLAKL